MNGNRGVGHRGRLRLEPAVAVVGLGYWGPNLVRVLIERSDVEVRWICDSDYPGSSALVGATRACS